MYPKEIKYKPRPAEQMQEVLATKIHKALAGQLKPANERILERLKGENHEKI